MGEEVLLGAAHACEEGVGWVRATIVGVFVDELLGELEPWGACVRKGAV